MRQRRDIGDAIKRERGERIGGFGRSRRRASFA